MPKFEVGDHVRIKGTPNVLQALRGKQGTVESCDPSPDARGAYVYSVRLDAPVGALTVASSIPEDSLAPL